MPCQRNQFSIQQLLEFAIVTALLMSLQSEMGPVSAGLLSLYFAILRLGRIVFGLFFLWMALSLALDNSGFLVCGLGLAVTALAIGLERVGACAEIKDEAKGKG